MIMVGNEPNVSAAAHWKDMTKQSALRAEQHKTIKNLSYFVNHPDGNKTLNADFDWKHRS